MEQLRFPGENSQMKMTQELIHLNVLIQTTECLEIIAILTKISKENNDEHLVKHCAENRE